MGRREIRKPKQSMNGQRFEYPPSEPSPRVKDNPVFSFHYLQDSHCISKCSEEQRLSFVEKMRLLSKLSWNEIKSTQPHGLGSEKISRNSFSVNIPDFVSEDEDLIALRFWTRAPMVGIRRNQIFHIIWFDKDFDVYNHGS